MGTMQKGFWIVVDNLPVVPTWTVWLKKAGAQDACCSLFQSLTKAGSPCFTARASIIHLLTRLLQQQKSFCPLKSSTNSSEIYVPKLWPLHSHSNHDCIGQTVADWPNGSRLVKLTVLCHTWSQASRLLSSICYLKGADFQIKGLCWLGKPVLSCKLLLA